MFAEQETESSWIHRMFAYGNILFFIGKYDDILFHTLSRDAGSLKKNLDTRKILVGAH